MLNENYMIEKNIAAFKKELKDLAPQIADNQITVSEVITVWSQIFSEIPEIQGILEKLCN